MGFDDRLVYFLVGCLVGAILGYMGRSLREIKEELDEVDEIVKNTLGDDVNPHKRSERGFVRFPLVADAALLLVLCLTLWATFSTAKVNSELQHTIDCITNYNVHQGKAFKQRDNSVKAGTQSEINLWKEYARLYAIAKSDPSKIPVLQEKLNRAIGAHRESLSELQDTRDSFPYANPNVLENCQKEN